MAITAFTDIVSLAMVMGVTMIFYMIGYFTKIGALYVVGMLLSLYAMANTFANQTVTYVSGFDPNTKTFTNQNVDANLMVVILIMWVMVGFLLIVYEKRNS